MSKVDITKTGSEDGHVVPSLHKVVLPRDDLEAHAGVAKVKATHRVFGKVTRWFLFIGLGLASYIYSLDSQTTWAYLAWAASEFENHSLIATIQVAQAIIVAVGKPAIAKLADTQSRGVAYTAVLMFYVVGYIVIASAQSIQAVAGGIIVYAIGYTGLQLLTSIIIADITTLQWRGLTSGLTSMPFLINGFIGSNISSKVVAGAGWRWGYGMFAILIPAALSPLIVTLVWAELKAKKLGYVPEKPKETLKFHQRVLRFFARLDIIGLILIGTSVALILLPLTLARTAKDGWKNPSMIAMVVVGCVLLPFIVPWEYKFTKYPVVPFKFFKNRSIVGACIIGFFDFISFYLTYAYLYSFVVVVKPWTLTNATYFTLTQSVGLTFFGIIAGILMRFTHRYKLMLIIGLTIRLAGVGMMLHSRGANSSDVEIVWTQILQSMGGGIAAVTSSVASQASVPHIDVATATAVVLLITEIGGAIGNSIAGAIWTGSMPGKLAKYVPLPQAERDALYGSITTVLTYPRGDPVREGVIRAYSEVMHTMIIIATVVAVVPLIVAFFMPNWYLGDTQNAVDHEDLTGDVVSQPTELSKNSKEDARNDLSA